MNSFYIDDRRPQTVKLIVAPGSPLVGRKLGFLKEARQVTILSHRRKNREAELFPSEEVVLQVEDKVAVLGQSHVIGQLHALNQPA